MLVAGDQVPEATVWLRPHEAVTIATLVEAQAGLFLFYLFDWSST